MWVSRTAGWPIVGMPHGVPVACGSNNPPFQLETGRLRSVTADTDRRPLGRGVLAGLNVTRTPESLKPGKHPRNQGVFRPFSISKPGAVSGICRSGALLTTC